MLFWFIIHVYMYAFVYICRYFLYIHKSKNICVNALHVKYLNVYVYFLMYTQTTDIYKCLDESRT